jgi:hypothetical protein
MSFPINTAIPASGNNPSNDQPEMLQNNLNINSYLTVDHVEAGANQNGIHLQSSYVARTTPANLINAINGNTSNGIAYVNSAANNDYYYYNGPAANQSNYPLNLIRAHGYFTVSGGAVTLINGFNMNPVVTYSGVGQYAVFFTQPAGATSYGYLLSAQDVPSVGGGDVRSSVTTSHPPNGVNLEFTKRQGGSNFFYDPISFTLTILVV